MIAEIKRRAKRKMEQNGNEKISNKELLWYMVDKFDEYEKRISKLEAIQYIMIIVFSALLTFIIVL